MTPKEQARCVQLLQRWRNLVASMLSDDDQEDDVWRQLSRLTTETDAFLFPDLDDVESTDVGSNGTVKS